MLGLTKNHILKGSAFDVVHSLAMKKKLTKLKKLNKYTFYDEKFKILEIIKKERINAAKKKFQFWNLMDC